MNSIVKAENTSLAMPAGVDPLQHFADSAAPQAIVGKLLRFSKGDWLAGQDGIEVKEGTPFIASLDDAVVGWQKWHDRKPVEHHLMPLHLSHRMALRDDLGDLDESRWEVDAYGNRKDPWQRAVYVPMVDMSGEPHTFTSGSRGGIGAIGKLARAIIRGRAQHANELPIIALKTEAYLHADYGRIKKPSFPIVGWAARARFDKAMANAGGGGAAEPPQATVAPAPSDMPRPDLDDTIPF